MDLKKYIDSVKDWPIEGINFKDISPLLLNPKVFEESIKGMCKLISEKPLMLEGVDSISFIFFPFIYVILNNIFKIIY